MGKATEGMGSEGLLRATGTMLLAVRAVLLGAVWLVVKVFVAMLKVALFSTRW